MDSHTQANARRVPVATTDATALETRRRLVQALEDQLVAGGPVSVSAIARRACIARSTFYTHFFSIEDLVVFVLRGMLESVGTQDELLRQSAGISYREASRQGLALMLARFLEARELLLYAIQRSAGLGISDVLIGEWAQGIALRVRAERRELSEAEIDYMSKYMAGGLLSVLFQWLQDPGAMRQDAIVELLLDLLPTWLTTTDYPESP